MAIITNIPAFIGIIINFFAATVLAFFTYRTYEKFQESKNKSGGIRTLLILYITTFFTIFAMLIIRTVETFVSDLPEAVSDLLYILPIFFGAINAVYTLTFIVKAFSIHPPEWILSILYYLLGIILGMVLMSYFALNEARPLIENIIGLFVLSESIVTIYYAFISAKRQKIMLIKASMKYYGYGNLIFFMILMTSIGLAEMANQIMLDNLLRVGQAIHASFMYIAFFKPKWFKIRYQKETAYIEKAFSNVRILDKK